MLTKFWHRYGTDVVWLSALLLCGLKFTHHLPQIIDYPISDEGAYLQDGLDIPLKGVKPVYWGSLYNIWYYIGSLLIPDKIMLYYAHLRLLTIGIPFLLYILLRIIGISPAVSFTSAFLYLLSFGNLYIFHKGNHTALFLMLVVLVCGYRLHHKIHFWLLAAMAILMSAFIRPELFMAFWLAISVYVFLILKSNLIKIKKLIIVITILLSTFYLSRLMFAHQNRSFYTFQSNFPVNWVKWTNSNLDPDQNNSLLFKQAFGNATTIGQAFESNPSLFFKNILWNIRGMGENYIKLGLTHFNILLPATRRSFTFIEGMIFTLILLVLTWKAHRKNKDLVLKIKENARWFLFSCFLGVPCLITNMLFYPRYNYIMLPVFLTFLLFPILFLKNPEKTLSYSKMIGIILLLFALTPSPTLGNNWYFAPVERNNNFDKTPVKNCVEAINALPLKYSVVSFIAEKATFQYTSKLINGVSIFHDGISVEEFIRANKIELVVVSNLLLTNNMVNEIVGFPSFIAHPEAYSFKQLPIRNTTTYLLVSQSALNN